MTAVKVSVIIPVYNTEQYLGQCLDSVIGQTLKDIEIICVDDGSWDRSPEILRWHAAADGRIRIIRQQNSGLGEARNSGLKAATGEYIAFLDSDDWYEPAALEKLYEQAVKDDADICMCGRINHLDRCGNEVSYLTLPNRAGYSGHFVLWISQRTEAQARFAIQRSRKMPRFRNSSAVFIQTLRYSSGRLYIMAVRLSGLITR